MSSQHHIIRIEPAAPVKPALGAPCNGCGVCCLYEPCPLGVLLSRRRHGACVALSWQAGSRQYRCGALNPPAVLRWSAPLVRRWIAAGRGCDSSLVVEADTGPARP